MLSEEQIQALRVQHGRVGVIDYQGHQIVFARPTRASIQAHRRAMVSGGDQAAGASDGLAQSCLVALDGETDRPKAIQAFSRFLEEFPAYTSNDKHMSVMNVLSGATEEEDEKALGKAARIYAASPAS